MNQAHWKTRRTAPGSSPHRTVILSLTDWLHQGVRPSSVGGPDILSPCCGRAATRRTDIWSATTTAWAPCGGGFGPGRQRRSSTPSLEVEVVTDEAIGQQATSWNLDEVHLEVLPDGPLASLRDQRSAHRDLPGYGVLANRGLVYLRDTSAEDDGVVYLAEVGPDGRRRQVEQRPDGDALRTENWPFNPPIDLRDPQYAPMEISAQAFEDAWRRARPDPDAY